MAVIFSLSLVLLHEAAARQRYKVTIRASVQDSVLKSPLRYATINLTSPSGAEQRKVLSDQNGKFSIAGLAPGNYTLRISSIGFNKKELSVEIKDSLSASLETIYLSPAATQLREVVIKADKQLVTQEIDRIIYDVQADPDSRGRQAIDIIKKVPLLSFAADGKLQIRGGGSYKALLNGKTSSMTNNNLESFLSSLPAEVLSKIEVITGPFAKFESEGFEGILNIVLKKRISDGYNGTSQASYNTIGGPRSTATVTFREKKLIIFGSLLYSRQDPIESSSTNHRTTTSESSLSRVINNGTKRWMGNYISSSDELSYELDSLNLITATFGLSRLDRHQRANQQLLRFDNDFPTYSYAQSSNLEEALGGLDLGLNYQKSFKGSNYKLLNGSFKRTEARNSGFSTNEVDLATNYNGNNFDQRNRYGSIEQTFQIDYANTVNKKISTEGGGKIILRDNYSDFSTTDSPDKTGQEGSNDNAFNYRQNIYALYNSWQLRQQTWGIRAGLRLERTVIDADFTTTNSGVSESYTNFIPSISIQKRLPEKNNLLFGYSQRIQRPGITRLNPFRNRINSLTYQFGNPELQPVHNHNFEVYFSSYKKASLYLGLSYSFANNTIQNVTTLSRDSISMSSFENVGKSRSLGTNVYFKYPLLKSVEITLNGRITRISIEGFIRGAHYTNTGLQGNASSEFSFKLPLTVRSSFELAYNSPRVILQGSTNDLLSTTFSVVKDLLNKKASLTLFVRNPFQKFFTSASYLTASTFTQETRDKNHFRGTDLLFVYRFGRLKEQVKRNKRGITIDDRL